jgi:hypothetical protein
VHDTLSAGEAKQHAKRIAKSKEQGTTIWDFDTVYKAGVPYCLMYRVFMGNGVHSDYSIRSFEGKELIYIGGRIGMDFSAQHQQNTHPPYVEYNSFYFTDSKQFAETPYSDGFKVVEGNNLIDDGRRIDTANEAKFLKLYPRRYSFRDNPHPDYTLIDRDRGDEIMIDRGYITQSGKHIGDVEVSKQAIPGYDSITVMKVHLPDVTKVAEITSQPGNPHLWKVVTMRDNLYYMLNNTDDKDLLHIIESLIKRLYL